jgi:hypothetical protein
LSSQAVVAVVESLYTNLKLDTSWPPSHI